MAGEFEFLQWIAAQYERAPGIEVGVGDDMAVMKWGTGDLLLVGVDQVLDGVHFDSQVHSPREIARKVVNRNLSDCAAMGCLPAGMVAAVALPRSFSLEMAKEFYWGLRDAGDAYECPLVGGDTGVWDGKLSACVTMWGKSAGVRPVTRSGAKVGDGIFVTGALGGSILGRHMTFEPRVWEGRKLAELGVHTMIDLSDGVSQDLGHICRAGGVGAVIEAARVPVHSDALTLSARDGRSGLEHALHDGEDYELLYCAESGADIRIGRIVAEPGVWIQHPDGAREELKVLGWEHRLHVH